MKESVLSDVMINLLEVSFATDESKEEFMDTVENDDSVFSFDCIGVSIDLDSVSFKPLGDGFMFLFLTDNEDVKGELQVLSEEFPEVSFNYLIISPGDRESIISMQIEAGHVLSTQTIIGRAATLIGEMAKGGFAG